jgi:hypothetical protein
MWWHAVHVVTCGGMWWDVVGCGGVWWRAVAYGGMRWRVVQAKRGGSASTAWLPRFRFVHGQQRWHNHGGGGPSACEDNCRLLWRPWWVKRLCSPPLFTCVRARARVCVYGCMYVRRADLFWHNQAL